MRKRVLLDVVLSSLLLGFIFCIILPTQSAGPLSIVNGRPGVYLGPMIYRIDKGMLGQLSNTEAVQIVKDSFSVWENVATSTLSFVEDSQGNIKRDIGVRNAKKFLKNKFLGYTAIIFDSHGGILKRFGLGLQNQVLGFAFAINGDTHRYTSESRAYINGRFYDGKSTLNNPEISEAVLRSTIIHEIGHAFGLDHSQANGADYTSGVGTVDDAVVPIMYPIAVNDSITLHRDDESSISSLYPNTAVLNLGFSSISGNLFDPDCATPIQGANVIARLVGSETTEAVSCVSDYLTTETGEFNFIGLTPGNYQIEVESINSNFVDGSSVGPFAVLPNVPNGYYSGVDSDQLVAEGIAGTVDVTMAGDSETDIDLIATLGATACSVEGIDNIGTAPDASNLTLDIPSPLSVSSSRKAIIALTNDDLSKTNCFIYTYGDYQLKRQPRKRKLNLRHNMAQYKLVVSKIQASEIIAAATSATVNILVACSDGQIITDTFTLDP